MKRYILLFPDAIQGGESSIPSAHGASSTDAISQDSSLGNENDENKDGKDKQPSLSSIIDTIKAKHGIDQPASESSTAVKKDGDKEKTPEELEAEAAEASRVQQLNETKKKADEAKLNGKTDDSKLPFHNHPRFKQVINERNDFEKKFTEIQATVKPLSERAQRMQAVEDFCTKNNIPAQDYDASIRLAGLVRTNPKEALVKLKEITSALEIQLGDSLPADLQKQVDDGVIPLTQAQEISRLRLDKNVAENRIKVAQQTVEQQAKQQTVTALNDWTQSKIKSDPSFKPKATATDADGKYELVVKAFIADWQTNPPKTSQESIAIAERAYQSIHQFIEASIPKPTIRRPLKPKASEPPKDEVVDTSKPGWARRAVAASFAGR